MYYKFECISNISPNFLYTKLHKIFLRIFFLFLYYFVYLIHLLSSPLWLYANWRCPARLFSAARLVPNAFGLWAIRCVFFLSFLSVFQFFRCLISYILLRAN